MKRLRKHTKSKRRIVITATMFLCFVTFVTNLIAAVKTGNISTEAYAQLATTADGFGAMCSAIIAVVLRAKNK